MFFKSEKLISHGCCLLQKTFKLMNHLKDIQHKNLEIVNRKQFNNDLREAFKSSSQSVLAHLILFNRRREGEVSQLLMSPFAAKTVASKENRELYECLTLLEKNCAIGSLELKSPEIEEELCLFY